MSPDMAKNIATERAGMDALARLERRAFAGDLAATIALVGLARRATQAVHGLWFNDAPMLPRPFFHAFNGEAPEPCAVTTLAARREALQVWASKQPFPTLHYWGVDEDAAAKAVAILRGVEHGPLKGGAHADSAVGQLVHGRILPGFEDIQMRPEPGPSGILDAAIWKAARLPDRKAASQWSSLAADWLMANGGEEVKPGGALYRLANPERVREKNQIKRMDAHRKRRARMMKERSLKSSDEPHFADKMRLDLDLKKIKNLQVTPAHVREGLRGKILKWLRDNLPVVG